MPDLDTLSAIEVTDLREGDLIVNVGEVQAPIARLGVWVIAEVHTTKPGLGTGRIHEVRENVIYHEADTVVVVQAEED